MRRLPAGRRVCSRNVPVRVSILSPSGRAHCAQVDLRDQSVANLHDGDFEGLARLQTLDLSRNLFTSLPKQRFALVWSSEGAVWHPIPREHPQAVSWRADGLFSFGWSTDPSVPRELREAVELLEQGKTRWFSGIIESCRPGHSVASSGDLQQRRNRHSSFAQWNRNVRSSSFDTRPRLKDALLGRHSPAIEYLSGRSPFRSIWDLAALAFAPAICRHQSLVCRSWSVERNRTALAHLEPAERAPPLERVHQGHAH